MKKILILSLLVLFGCSKVDLQTPEGIDSQSDGVIFYQLNLLAGPNGYTGSNGWVSLHLTKPSEYFKYQRVQDRAGISPKLPAGIEITIIATPKEGYYFDKWSNGWTSNPKTFMFNSDVDAIAIFKKDLSR